MKGIQMIKRIFGKLIRGIPEQPATAENSPAVGDYISESELRSQIHAGADVSEWEPWLNSKNEQRRDPDNEPWYRRIGTIAANAASDDFQEPNESDLSDSGDDQSPFADHSIDASDDVESPIDWDKFDAAFENLGNEIEAAAEPFDRVAFDAKFEELRERFPDPGFDITSYQPEGRYDE